MKIQWIAATLTWLLLSGGALAEAPANPTAVQLHDYWYPNGAEITRYALTQSRYGEIHKGDAVLVFVTEAMNPGLQVKADHPTAADVPVLKLNATRKFYTGIYPYSVMTSVFSPLAAGPGRLPLKISFTSQEWCGQVYMQMNLRKARYQVQRRSYFETEGDQDFSLPAAISEDALWTRIRIAPASLPTGRFKLIPGALYTRLLHRPITMQTVQATLAKETSGDFGPSTLAYTVTWPAEKRALRIVFERSFPHRILGWEDRHPALASMGAKMLTTRAVRTHSLMIDYWRRHTNRDRALLKKLGLTPHG